MSTPHNNAAKGEFAKTVLMPGDPLRAKFIAETFFTEPKLVNNVRGVQGYTGTYKGVPVSVMASGMGMPSIGIYAYELYTHYDVDNIIRVGSAGAMRADLELGSVMGVMAVEMEAAGLYCTAAYTGKRALAICSISDNLITGEELTAEERQTTFTNMMKIALEAAVKMAAK